MKKKMKGILLTAIITIFLVSLAVPLSYIIHTSLETKQFVAEWNVNKWVDGLFNNPMQQKIFLPLALLLAFAPLLMHFFIDSGYKADTISITPEIKIPAPAGQGQNGTARFMTSREILENYGVYTFNKNTALYNQMIRNGEKISKGVKKGEYLLPKDLTGIEKYLPHKGGLVIGRTSNGSSEKITFIDKDYHSLIFGATGSGKTRTLVLQSIIYTAMSGEGIVVNDPKGEIYYYTHRVLQSLGYEIIVVDLQNPEKSKCKNLLAPIVAAVKKQRYDIAQRATWDLVEMIVAKNDKSEPIWTNGEKSIIGACILAVVCDNVEHPEYQTLANVYYFISNMVKSDGGGTPLERYIANLPETHPAKALLGITDVAPSKTRGSFYTSALTSLRLFATNDIASVTGRDDFDFLDITKKKQAMFYILPDQKTTYYSIVTLLVNQQYEMLVDYAKEHGNRLPRRVNFFLDEFGNFTPINDIQAKLTVARGYGIRFNLFIQDEAQLKDKYDENVAKIIMGNCSVWVYLASSSKETREMISARLGKYTTLKFSSSGSKQRFTNPSRGYSTNLEGRELLMPDEIDKLHRPYQLVMTIGKNPAIVVSPDLSQWSFNAIMGLGNEEHNQKFIEVVSSNRPNMLDTSVDIPLWKPWIKDYDYDVEYKETDKNSNETDEQPAVHKSDFTEFLKNSKKKGKSLYDYINR